jgi:chorismate mutase / prephenate dehydratase
MKNSLRSADPSLPPASFANPNGAAIQASLRELDQHLLALVQQRAELMHRWKQESPDAFPSLLEAVRDVNPLLDSSPRPLSGDPVTAGDSSRPGSDHDLCRSVVAYVVGASHAHASGRSRIAYLGPEQSYSYLAACKFFGASSGLEGVRSIGAVFEEVVRDQSRYGVVPIENSTDGRIVDTLTMFIKTPIQICGEILLPIHHNLLARCARSQIRIVYSKPQALSQCRGWLAEHLPDARCVEVGSTTAAAKIAAEEPGAAAVASIEAAIQNGLNVIAQSIEDHSNNATRFAIIGKELPAPTGNDKTSLLFQVPHKPGALADVMVLFKNHGLNLTWIESFPVPGLANEYFFFVELDGHRASANVELVIEQLSRDALRLDWLGSYPKSSST